VREDEGNGIDGMESSFIVVVDDTRRPNVTPGRIGLLVLDGFVVVGTVVLVVLVGVSSSFCGRNVVRAGVNMGGVDDDLLLGSSIVDAVDDVPPPRESFVVSYARKKFRGVILPGVVVAEEEEGLLPRAEGDDEMMTGRLDLMAVNDKGDAVGSRAAVEEDPSL